jgi:prostaglandin reductase 1
MVQAKKFIYASAFKGEPKLSDFKLVEEELPALKDGEILIEAQYWSVDPYMRPYMSRYPIGSQMIGGQVAK